ncbi:MAG: T9SS type A sorting domain-containing protein [bacterium]
MGYEIRDMRCGIRDNWLFVVILWLASGFGYQVSAQTAITSSNLLAWTGGLNSCQFCGIDLNLDGVEDLLVFDRDGNRILPLIYQGSPGTVNYLPDTSLASQFPDLHDWVLTADYNCDGKMDLFTYGLGGIRVFRNVSDTVLKFHLETNMLTSWFYTGYIGILVTPVDYPAVSDIDGDGDLDILTFFGLGSFVEYHQNLSMEKYGNCDSLDYRLADNCWGKFKESEGSNKITLNTDCPTTSWQLAVGNTRSSVTSHQSSVTSHEFTSHVSHLTSHDKHTGSTMLAMDLNGDGLKDLILGDVDFPNLIALVNGGTPDTAFMTGFDTLFPSGDRPVHLFDFPIASYVDADHDGLKDLIVSPFDPVLTNADNIQSVWFYKNTGNQDIPVFTWQTSGLFQQEMIDVGSNSYPVLYDLNGDGLDDLLLGCWGLYDSSYYQSAILKSVYTGRIALFENTGNKKHPVFTFISGDLGAISAYGLTGIFPAVRDLTGDGNADLIVGQDDGTLAFFRNDGTGSYPPVYLPPLWKYKGIDVGENSTPQLFDFNGDGLPDLIIGEKNGNLNYYENRGSAGDPLFVFITDSLGKVNVTNYQISYSGYSTPCFFTDRQGNSRLLVGSEEGKVWFYSVPDHDPGARYLPSDSLYLLVTAEPFPVRCGWRTSPAVGYLSDSLKMDFLVGNYSGGVNYFSQNGPPEVLLASAPEIETQWLRVKLFPNPADSKCTVQLPGIAGDRTLYVEVLTRFGQCIIRQILDGSATLSLGDLPVGLYLVRLIDPSGHSLFSAAKLIVLH